MAGSGAATSYVAPNKHDVSGVQVRSTVDAADCDSYC